MAALELAEGSHAVDGLFGDATICWLHSQRHLLDWLGKFRPECPAGLLISKPGGRVRLQ